MNNGLKVEDLYVSVEGKTILWGVNLEVNYGEVHAIMGPNGAGKSTLGFAILGHPKYKIEKGKISFNGQDILLLKPNERAKLGIFLLFQYPHEVQGLILGRFLWSVFGGGKKFPEFMKELKQKMSLLKMSEEFSKRELNVGFSGGEKKRSEVLQMLLMKPKLAILDEPDSGLDVDATYAVAEAINSTRKETSSIIITHYPRILNYVRPDAVHIFHNGRVILSGDMSLAKEIEEKGYEAKFEELNLNQNLN